MREQGCARGGGRRLGGKNRGGGGRVYLPLCPALPQVGGTLVAPPIFQSVREEVVSRQFCCLRHWAQLKSLLLEIREACVRFLGILSICGANLFIFQHKGKRGTIKSNDFFAGDKRFDGLRSRVLSPPSGRSAGRRDQPSLRTDKPMASWWSLSSWCRLQFLCFPELFATRAQTHLD